MLLPDAAPLITLAYAGALDVLFKPGWQVRVVDMVLHEVTRSGAPTPQAIAQWVQSHSVTIVKTQTSQHYQAALSQGAATAVRKANLGELAVQEAMHEMALKQPERVGVFLFEDHKIARASFLVPENCRKVSTRAYLQFLQGKGLIGSAAGIERAAIVAGRNFSQLRFP